MFLSFPTFRYLASQPPWFCCLFSWRWLHLFHMLTVLCLWHRPGSPLNIQPSGHACSSTLVLCSVRAGTLYDSYPYLLLRRLTQFLAHGPVDNCTEPGINYKGPEELGNLLTAKAEWLWMASCLHNDFYLFLSFPAVFELCLRAQRWVSLGSVIAPQSKLWTRVCMSPYVIPNSKICLGDLKRLVKTTKV